VEIEPNRVVLYDNTTSVTVTLRVIDEVTKDASMSVALIHFITLDEADDDRLLNRAIPDFRPGTNSQRRSFHCHSSVASKRSLARSLSLGSTNRSSPARPSRAVADAPPPARPHISWALPEHKSYLQTSQTHVAVVQRISLPPPDE